MATELETGAKLWEGNDYLNRTNNNFNTQALNDAILSHAHTGSTGDAAKLDDTGLANGAATDTIIGNRTINDATAPTGNTAALATLLSNLANMLKSISGEETWRTAPRNTIAQLDADLTNVENELLSIMNANDPLGAPRPYFSTVLPDRFLWCDGKTIGSATSGATARANADTQNLFNALWTASGLGIYESNGNTSSRGASAAADWAANKRIALPKINGRTLIGIDNLGGTAANVLSTANSPNRNVIGGTGGEETHSLTAIEGPAHTHAVEGSGYLYRRPSGGGADVVAGAAYDIATITASAGDGVAHNTMQPWLACNWIIRY